MRANRTHRKPEVSNGRTIRVGLVGPKPRAKAVGEGQQVNIPVPISGSDGVTLKDRPAWGWRCQVPSVWPMTVAGKSATRGEGVMAKPRKADKWLSPSSQEKPLSDELRSPVPQTDTGGQVEKTKVSERTLVKELGKIEP